MRAPSTLVLPPDEVHLWRAWQDMPAGLIATLEDTLSQDEKVRAHRFVTRQLTDRFIAAHGFLRNVLGAYLGLRASSLSFSHGSHGKPSLVGLRFNLTHSHGLAVLAVSSSRELGVDVEHIRPEVLGEGIAERFFSPREVEMLHALPERDRPLGFFHCWTRKEAYLKALGWGLSIPLDRFDVSLSPHEDARLLADRGTADLDRWRLQSFDPDPGWCGAVVGEGRDWHVRSFDWVRPL